MVKATPLTYQTIYVTEFYSEDFFTWCKLEGKNQDKVVVGDFLIVKKAGEKILFNPTKLKVLDIKEFDEDFIKNNTDQEGEDIIERPGLYMKIRPLGFSMDNDDFKVKVDRSDVGDAKNGFPVTLLDLFTTNAAADGEPVDLQELAIPAGTSITLRINSSRNYDDGWKNVDYDNEFYAQRDYDTIEEWFDEIIFGRTSLKADDGSEEFDYDYLPSITFAKSLGCASTA